VAHDGNVGTPEVFIWIMAIPSPFVFRSRPAAVAFTAPVVLGSAITIDSRGDVAYFLVAVLMVSYVSVLWRGIYVYALQLVSRVSAQVEAERKVRRDELTNLSNRLALLKRLKVLLRD